MRYRIRSVFAAAVISSCAAVLVAQTPQTIPPADNLVADGIPPISASLAREVGRYTESRSAVLTDWHPQRREMLISTRFANAPQIHLVTAPGAARTQVTFEAEPVTRAL